MMNYMYASPNARTGRMYVETGENLGTHPIRRSADRRTDAATPGTPTVTTSYMTCYY